MIYFQFFHWKTNQPTHSCLYISPSFSLFPQYSSLFHIKQNFVVISDLEAIQHVWWSCLCSIDHLFNCLFSFPIQTLLNILLILSYFFLELNIIAAFVNGSGWFRFMYIMCFYKTALFTLSVLRFSGPLFVNWKLKIEMPACMCHSVNSRIFL